MPTVAAMLNKQYVYFYVFVQINYTVNMHYKFTTRSFDRLLNI